jgi:peroxiredoxin Q/BCP
VWGISPQGAGSKRKFREKFDLPFVLLADEQHAVAEAYGAWVEKQNYGKTYWGTARTTFLVDPDGRIERTWPKVKPEGHAADVLDALATLQAARVG